MHSLPRRTLLATALSAVLAGVLALAAPAAAQPSTAAATGSVYVALGDSYTAGPLIPPQSDLFTCVRSSADYPALLAQALHSTTFRDVSCSSAATQDFSSPQKGNIFGTNPPQYDALSADTTLVTVGIGGNDIGLVGLAEGCISLLPAPLGKSCAAKFTAGGVDQYSQKIQAFAPTYATIIAQIRNRAPHAKILLVGYPSAIRPGGCYPVQPLLAPDATYIQAKIDELNSVMKSQAQANGATYIDIRTSSVGHDSCALPGTRWVEGLIPLSPAFPLHPNELSMRNAAAQAQLQAGLTPAATG